MLEDRDVMYHGPFDSMQQAFTAAQAEVQPGDVLALVPGTASFGMFRNEFDRGNQFRECVHQLQEPVRDR
jgi:UDP-N-acetylmuramoylalanine--D-glutamate ligase